MAELMLAVNTQKRMALNSGKAASLELFPDLESPLNSPAHADLENFKQCTRVKIPSHFLKFIFMALWLRPVSRYVFGAMPLLG